MEERYYTAAEIATTLKLSLRTVQNYMKTGRIEAVKIGGVWRVSQSAIDKLLNPGK